jgi:molecular chaperone GrpE
VKLTLKMFLDELGKQNVVEINPVKEQFDPQNHSAMLVQPDNTVPNNTVLNVLQKGYKMFDRVIRPALVIVSKAD